MLGDRCAEVILLYRRGVEWLRYSLENMVLLGCGLIVGWVGVAWAPRWWGPVVAATVLLALAGRFLFDGTFQWLGLGMAITTLATVGLYVRDLVALPG